MEAGWRCIWSLGENPSNMDVVPSLNFPPEHGLYALLFAAAIGVSAVASGQAAPMEPLPSHLSPIPTTAPPDGWIFFDDAVAADLELNAAVLQRLRAVDDSYMREYIALGTAPTHTAQYRDLTERRTKDIQHILKPRTYTIWSRKYGTPYAAFEPLTERMDP